MVQSATDLNHFLARRHWTLQVLAKHGEVGERLSQRRCLTGLAHQRLSRHIWAAVPEHFLRSLGAELRRNKLVEVDEAAADAQHQLAVDDHDEDLLRADQVSARAQPLYVRLFHLA